MISAFDVSRDDTLNLDRERCATLSCGTLHGVCVSVKMFLRDS
jgi:hypothetical protein